MKTSVGRRAMRCGAALIALALPAGACSERAPSSDTVQLATWWSQAGERDALDALLDLFERQHPNQSVNEVPHPSAQEQRRWLQEKMVGGNPPETFQANGGWDLLSWALHNNSSERGNFMLPVNDIAADWDTDIPKSVLDTVEVGSRIYAVPLAVHRLNTLFFNRKVFADHGVEVPAGGAIGLDDLFAAADALHAAGVAKPIALGNEPWVLSLLLFENILIARSDGTFYRNFFRGDVDALSSPEVAAAVEDLGVLLSYTEPGLSWDRAVDAVVAEEAAMTIMGDWAKGYYLTKARQNMTTVNLEAMPTPGTQGIFVFTTDTFGLPSGARNPDGARELLRFFGSAAAQDTFSLIKGSIPARKDPAIAEYDPVGRQTIVDFQNAADDPTRLVPATAILAPPDYTAAIFEALSDFAGTTTLAGDVRGNASVVLHALQNRSDVLRDSPWQP